MNPFLIFLLTLLLSLHIYAQITPLNQPQPLRTVPSVGPLMIQLHLGTSNRLILAPGLVNDNQTVLPLIGFNLNYEVKDLPTWGSFSSNNNSLLFSPPGDFRGTRTINVTFSDPQKKSASILIQLSANLTQSWTQNFNLVANSSFHRSPNTWTLAYPLYTASNASNLSQISTLPNSAFLIDSCQVPWTTLVQLTTPTPLILQTNIPRLPSEVPLTVLTSTIPNLPTVIPVKNQSNTVITSPQNVPVNSNPQVNVPTNLNPQNPFLFSRNQTNQVAVLPPMASIVEMPRGRNQTSPNGQVVSPSELTESVQTNQPTKPIQSTQPVLIISQPVLTVPVKIQPVQTAPVQPVPLPTPVQQPEPIQAIQPVLTVPVSIQTVPIQPISTPIYTQPSSPSSGITFPIFSPLVFNNTSTPSSVVSQPTTTIISNQKNLTTNTIPVIPIVPVSTVPVFSTTPVTPQTTTVPTASTIPVVPNALLSENQTTVWAIPQNTQINQIPQNPRLSRESTLPRTNTTTTSTSFIVPSTPNSTDDLITGPSVSDQPKLAFLENGTRSILPPPSPPPPSLTPLNTTASALNSTNLPLAPFAPSIQTGNTTNLTSTIELSSNTSTPLHTPIPPIIPLPSTTTPPPHNSSETFQPIIVAPSIVVPIASPNNSFQQLSNDAISSTFPIRTLDLSNITISKQNSERTSNNLRTVSTPSEGSNLTKNEEAIPKREGTETPVNS